MNYLSELAADNKENLLKIKFGIISALKASNSSLVIMRAYETDHVGFYVTHFTKTSVSLVQLVWGRDNLYICLRYCNAEGDPLKEYPDIIHQITENIDIWLLADIANHPML
jgi:hypothetical protein